MMKRTLCIFLAAMILCLSFTGCSQNSAKLDEEPNNTAEQNTGETVNDTEAVDDDTSGQSDTEEVKESNEITEPINNDGLYTYELHGGITITCRTNVWDYIDGNSFDFRAMAHALGWTDDLNEMPECQGFTHDFDGQSVIIGFAGDERTDLYDPYFMFTCITRYGTDGGTREIAVEYYFDTSDIYTINGSGPKLSFDAIPIIAYALENFSLDNKDPFSEVFEAYKLPKEEKRVSWKDYRLP